MGFSSSLTDPALASISSKEGNPAVQEQGKQHVDIWDNGTSELHLGDSAGARLCLGLDGEHVLLVTASLQ